MNEGDTVASASALDFEDIEVEENKTEDKTAQPEQETLVK